MTSKPEGATPEQQALTFVQLALDAFRQPFNNTTRGVLVEALVARLVGGALRDPWSWADVDVDGRTLEVRSAADRQAWPAVPKRPRCAFDIGRKQAWSPETNEVTKEPARWADLYVFCHLHTDEMTEEAFMDFGNWTFYLVPTAVLDEQLRTAESISLARVRQLSPPVAADELGGTVRTSLAGIVPQPGPTWKGPRP